MGGGTFSSSDWKRYSSQTQQKSTSQIFTQKTVTNYLDPKNIAVRESCDSDANPNSTPIMVFLDVTGSMGEMARIIAQTGLGTIMEEIYARKPVSDPHLLFGAIGDIRTDRAPLQATQFEAEVAPMTTQLEQIFLEGNGGGNNGESYDLAWLFAATKTRIDSFLKRQKKGFLFTIGDEPPPPGLDVARTLDKTGLVIERNLTPAESLAMAQRQWECFHIFLQQGNYNHSLPAWQALMPERVIVAPDYTKLAELIVSTLQVYAGADIQTVASSWSGDTSLVVANALKGMVPGGGGVGLGPSDVVRF